MLEVKIKLRGQWIDMPPIGPGHVGSMASANGFILFGCAEDDDSALLYEAAPETFSEPGLLRIIDLLGGTARLLHTIDNGNNHEHQFFGDYGPTTILLCHNKGRGRSH